MHTIESNLLRNYSGIQHTFTTRDAGVSEKPYNSNNIAFHVGDNEKDVLLNHAVLARAVGYDMESLVHMRQIHSDKVVVIDKSYTFSNPPECDAMITDIPDKPLMVMTADCTPLLLYDPVSNVIGVVHAGRAGAFKNIIAKSIAKMQDLFQSRSSDIIAVLGPSIGVCCYEVNQEINDEAARLGMEYAMVQKEGRYYLDVNRILKQQLLHEGVTKEHTEEINRCSSCENDTFFSYRADGQKTGRMAGVILLKP